MLSRFLSQPEQIKIDRLIFNLIVIWFFGISLFSILLCGIFPVWFFHVWICHIWIFHVWILPMWRDEETPDLRPERRFPMWEYRDMARRSKNRLQRKKMPKIGLYPDNKSSCLSVHLGQRKPPVPQTDWLGHRDRRFGFSDCLRTADFVSFFIQGCHWIHFWTPQNHFPLWRCLHRRW